MTGLFQQTGRVDSGEVEGVKHILPPRNEGRFLLAVDVRPANGTVVAGTHWPHGKSRQVVYASQMEEVMSRVAKPEHVECWERSLKTHQRQLDEHIRKTTMGKEVDAASLQRIKDKYPGSAAVEFSRDFPTGCPPVISCEVLGEYAPPNTPENNQKNLLAELVAKLTDAGTQARAANLEAENAELRSTLAALTARLDALESTKKRG